MKNMHWIQGGRECEAPLFRREFVLEELPRRAELEICGLGCFLLFVNGMRVGDQECAPAPTAYSSVLGCEALYPVWEERSRYRTHYLVFDLLPFLKIGKNVLGVQLGNGWYHQTRRQAEGKFVFGFPKLHYELTITGQDGSREFLESDPETLWKPGEILENNLFYGETQDLRLYQKEWCTEAARSEGWAPALPVHGPETELVKQECPADRVIRQIRPVLQRKEEGRRIYDCGENISGWVVMRCPGEPGANVTVRHSEELTEDGKNLDFASAGGERQIQQDTYFCGETEQRVHPKFCWHGFRYFEVTGPGEPEAVSVVHTDIPVTSDFRCSSPVLNWLYEAYIRTQLNNFHGCIPSDCPHRERLGYTGDGQLTAEAAMLTLDVREVYRKWMGDILDSQGKDSGHIPHTAPFLGGGGGPGGWGCAVYQVPMAYYRIYGDLSLLREAYPAILRWLDYMYRHCENGLVVREEAGGWCLGEWCRPLADQEPEIPVPFVNTYYYIKGLLAVREASVLLEEELPDWVEVRAAESRKAMKARYFREDTESFCEGAGAADAFALDLGIGTAKTREQLIRRYREKGCLDTGIFGTPVLLETLFREGEGDLAYALLTEKTDASYAGMMESGATTLWETWDGRDSHDHPMFGSVVKLFFTEILGIRQKEGTAGFTEYRIEPAVIRNLDWAEGFLTTGQGILNVSWKKGADGKIETESRICPGEQGRSFRGRGEETYECGVE
ncbi:MAG: family 78 glycoside hydrolase catalytic domain [Candidatus Limivivens sp.]|nr:family 78 glycoside hydrolase catalytic domain [Candidatus Limivivens sp.]